MRATSIIIAAALLFTVNASAILKRQQDAGFDECAAALNSASNLVDTLTNDIKAITKDNQATQVSAYGKDYSQFSASALQVQQKCCTVPSNGADDAKASVYNSGEHFLGEVQLMLDAVRAQKAVLTSAGSLISSPILVTLTDLESSVDGISTCLVSNIPQTVGTMFQQKVTSLQKNFKEANTELAPAGPPNPTLP